VSAGRQATDEYALTHIFVHRMHEYSLGNIFVHRMGPDSNGDRLTVELSRAEAEALIDLLDMSVEEIGWELNPVELGLYEQVRDALKQTA
jgi:hypothetical protein